MTTDDDSTPGFRFTALSRFNDDVHLVNAPMDAVAYPTAYLTRCAKPVVAIYQDYGSRRARPCTGSRPASPKIHLLELCLHGPAALPRIGARHHCRRRDVRAVLALM
jgi:hypothetical protein